MTTLREAAQQALEALEGDPNAMIEVAEGHWEFKCDLAITALRAALAQQAELVAWMLTDAYNPKVRFLEWTQQPKGYRGDWIKTPLYTSPPQRKPLTDEEIDRATAQARDALLDHIYEYGTAAEGVLERIRKLCRAIERAHGIKENPDE